MPAPAPAEEPAPAPASAARDVRYPTQAFIEQTKFTCLPEAQLVQAAQSCVSS